MSASKNLTYDEERDLFLRIASGDKKARDEAVRANQGIIRQIVNKWSRGRAKDFYDDMMSAGNIGLLRAIDGFDVTLGNKFSTYAYPWIERMVKQELNHMRDQIGLPRASYHTRWRITRVVEKAIHNANGINLKEAVRAALDAEHISAERAFHIVNSLAIVPRRLDMPQAEGQDPLGDRISDEKPTPEEQLIHAQEHRRLRQTVRSLMNTLTPREKKIVRDRLSADKESVAKLTEIGSEFNLSRERIRQIEVKTKQTLAKPLSQFKPEGKQHHFIQASSDDDHLQALVEKFQVSTRLNKGSIREIKAPRDTSHKRVNVQHMRRDILLAKLREQFPTGIQVSLEDSASFCSQLIDSCRSEFEEQKLGIPRYGFVLKMMRELNGQGPLTEQETVSVKPEPKTKAGSINGDQPVTVPAPKPPAPVFRRKNTVAEAVWEHIQKCRTASTTAITVAVMMIHEKANIGAVNSSLYHLWARGYISKSSYERGRGCVWTMIEPATSQPSLDPR